MKTCKIITILLIIIFSSYLIACTNNISGGVNNTDLPSIDRSGNDIVIPNEIDKIISLAPSITQILFYLGVADSLIEVDTQSPMYANISAELPQYDMMLPDIEQIIALHPDIIFVSSMSNFEGMDIFRPVREAGICVAEIPSSSSINDIIKDIEFISECVGKTTEGTNIINDFVRKIEQISTIGNSISEKKTLLFEISAAPYIYSFGTGVFLNEMVEIIGAKNIFNEQIGWISITEESIIVANPDVILTNVNYIENPIEEIKNRKGWAKVTAVEDSQIFYIDNSTTSIPNHNITKALIEMAKAVYPNEYADVH